MKTPTLRHFALIPLLSSAMLVSSCQSTATGDLMNIGTSILQQTMGGTGVASALSQQDISAAFKQALQIGTGEVVSQLGVTNGFNLDPNIRIPLPDKLAQVQNILGKIGMSSLMDDLELRLNRAAEIATPHAKELFFNAITEMTFDDVMNIYQGPQDSATQYFKSKMSSPLSAKMSPFVNNAVSQAGVVQAYDNAISQYKSIPFVPDVKADLTTYVVDEGISGIFYYLGQQEQAIRQDPVRHTTELLKRVFGQK